MDLQPDIDVFVGNNTVIDLTLYDLWLKSLQPNEVIKYKKREQSSVSPDAVMSDILDQFRTLGLLEKYLKIPSSLAHQLSFQLSQDMQKELIIRYFKFDHAVIRELLGKKLSRSTYQNMDEVAERTGINHRCCLRQFENCRRVYKVVEDMPGSLVDNISAQFLLPKDLSWAYATVVFLASHRFECTKRKLNHMKFTNFITCVQHLCDNWTGTSEEKSSLINDGNIDIDREFLHDLRASKFLSSDKETVERLKLCFPDRVDDDFIPACRSLCRAIPVIGSSLYHTKDLRDFFVDIVEKIVEPAHVSRWSYSFLEEFLVHYAQVTSDNPHMSSNKSAWQRFLKVFNCCVLQAYY